METIDIDTLVKGPFTKKGVDIWLDDLCDRCGVQYCKVCEYEPHLCAFTHIEHCPKIPCLDCWVHKTRKKLGIQVPRTCGRR